MEHEMGSEYIKQNGANLDKIFRGENDLLGNQNLIRLYG